MNRFPIGMGLSAIQPLSCIAARSSSAFFSLAAISSAESKPEKTPDRWTFPTERRGPLYVRGWKLSPKSSRLLAALNAYVLDGCPHLPVGIDRYVEQKLKQQIVLCPLADQMKAPHGVDVRWEWGFEAEGVYG